MTKLFNLHIETIDKRTSCTTNMLFATKKEANKALKINLMAALADNSMIVDLDFGEIKFTENHMGVCPRGISAWFEKDEKRYVIGIASVHEYRVDFNKSAVEKIVKERLV